MDLGKTTELLINIKTWEYMFVGCWLLDTDIPKLPVMMAYLMALSPWPWQESDELHGMREFIQQLLPRAFF